MSKFFAGVAAMAILAAVLAMYERELSQPARDICFAIGCADGWELTERGIRNKAGDIRVFDLMFPYSVGVLIDCVPVDNLSFADRRYIARLLFETRAKLQARAVKEACEKATRVSRENVPASDRNHNERGRGAWDVIMLHPAD